MKNILLLLLISPLLFSLEFYMTSWNIRNISMNKIQDRDLNTLRRFYGERRDYDVHIIQELRDKYVINMLSVDYRAVTSKKAKGRGNHKEFYGFLVNKKFKDVKLFDSRAYRKFQRPPSVIILDKKIAVINVHIFHGGDNSKNSLGKRMQEVKALKDIRKQIHNKYKIPYKNIIIAGDFNLESRQIGVSLKDKSKVWINKPTTIGRSNRYGNSYDHFITHREIEGKTRVVKEIIKNRKSKYFIKKVSDHLPIEGKFSLIELKK